MLFKRLFLDLLGLGKWRKANFNDCVKDIIASIVSDGKPNPFLDPYQCMAYVDKLHKEYNVNFSWGGYLEDRKDLWKGHYHPKGHTIHLGVDYNVPIHTRVHLPVTAKLVHRMDDPDKHGGWGGRLIFETKHIYLLFAHVKYHVSGVGSFYEIGEPIASIAEPECNGGWYPHLHVQCMAKHVPYLEVDGYATYYKGIEKDFPDPEVVLS